MEKNIDVSELKKYMRKKSELKKRVVAVIPKAAAYFK